MASIRLTMIVLGLFGLMATFAAAEDWPQWMGPQRDNIWREKGIVDKFPEGGPKVLWRTPLAGGYAGPAVADGRVFVTDYTSSENVKVDNFQRKEFTGTERVLCLDEQTGKKLWEHEYPVKYTVSYPAGPRCTPTVDGDRVYFLGAEGHLFCCDVKKGTVHWSKHFAEEYGTKTALWGYASHPLVDGDKLICVVGGEGTHAVAFNKKTGEEIWRTESSTEQGYSPPSIVEIGGLRQLLLFRPGAISGVDPETGKPYWSVPYEASNGSVIMTPIVKDRYVYAAGYSNHNLLVEVGEDGRSAKAVWQDLGKQAISPVNVQPFLVGDIIYGCDQNGTLYAIDLATGERIWGTNEHLNSERPVGSGTSFIVKQGDRFWLFNEQGELIICKLDRDGYHEIDSTKVIDPTNFAFGREVVWCMPAYANRHAYIRNDQECICVDLSAN
ncbi:MAG: PQQ-binding-like beta-propeller repeat protein [Planctomycetaceae bacterium]|nr:PQQ-binding-like beta-propeller repeat protein [Planctomycetaceae bacterium]